MREHLVVPAVGSRKVARAQRPNVRRFVHFLQLLDVVNDAFGVHSVPISNISVLIVKRGGICRCAPTLASLRCEGYPCASIGFYNYPNEVRYL